MRWLSPSILLKAGVDVGVSATFGRFADKREVETVAQDAPFDYSDRGELWLDFLSDTGDSWEATYTMAWLLAQQELTVGDRKLPRADGLLLGGDQVYPAPGIEGEAYEDRFIGPFSAAAAAEKPTRDLFAIPGNHDWYDGLVSFQRIFCRPPEIGAKQIGDWTTRQTRSYWALRLPHDWWVWAIDIQLDTYIDNAQLEYFATVGKELGEGHRVILLTAKPSWVKAEADHFAPASWRNLAYFERTMISEKGAELALTLTGDLHHYSRYEPRTVEAGPTRITAGGGGAYLSATHTLPERIEPIPQQGADAVPYKREQIYPRRKQSKHLGWGILGIPRKNPAFAALLGAFYAAIAAAVLGSLNAADARLIETAQDGGVSLFLANATSGTSIAVGLVLLAILVGYADFKSLPARALVGGLHGAVHLAGALAVVYGLAQLYDTTDQGVVLWAAAGTGCFVAGFVVGGFLFGAYLFIVHRVRGDRSPKHTNEVFAGQGIVDYKNFLRLHVDRDGSLTIYPLGVPKACRKWDFRGREAAPWFVPRKESPKVELADREWHGSAR